MKTETIKPTRVGRIWPVAAAVLLFVLLLGAVLLAGLRSCDWRLIYPMDDTYIHMAMAKNFALHGVWGVTRYAFSSSSSSPFYTFVLAVVYWLTGVREATPLILNAIAAILVLVVADRALARSTIRPLLRFLCLALVILAAPLPILALGGMEHVLHFLFVLLFLPFYCSVLLEPQPGRSTLPLLLLLAAGLTTVRYESVFIVATAALLLLLRRKPVKAILLGLAGLLPLALYGWIAVLHGWYAIPNSILMKANRPHLSGAIRVFVDGILFNAHWAPWLPWMILVMACLTYLTFRKHGTFWHPVTVALFVLAVSTVLHLSFARVGWFFRYEAYLIGLTVVWIVIALADLWPVTGRPERSQIVVFGLVAVAMGAFVYLDGLRVNDAFLHASLAMKNIYDQPYQMGLFARDALPGETLLLDDIGAITFLSDHPILDAVGLGSMAPAYAQHNHLFSTPWLHSWAKSSGAAAAFIHISGPYGVPPSPEWSPEGAWKIPDRYVLACDTVNFYAINPARAAALHQEISAFEKRLPRDVTVRVPARSH